MRYLLPNSVVDYIEQNGLYQDESANSPTVTHSDKGKEREREKDADRDHSLGASKKELH